MESLKAKVRIVPEDRIKQLYSTMHIWEGVEDIEYRIEEIIREMGLELAAKLVEFHKIEIKKGDIVGSITLTSKLEVIIPPTPENPWPPKDN